MKEFKDITELLNILKSKNNLFYSVQVDRNPKEGFYQCSLSPRPYTSHNDDYLALKIQDKALPLLIKAVQDSTQVIELETNIKIKDDNQGRTLTAPWTSILKTNHRSIETYKIHSSSPIYKLLAEGLANNSTLTQLIFSMHRPGKESLNIPFYAFSAYSDWFPFSEQLAVNTTLISLNLDDESYTPIPLIFSSLMSALTKNKALRELDLKYAVSGEQDARELSHMLSVNTTLKKLSLSTEKNLKHYSRWMETLSPGLIKNQSLECLNLFYDSDQANDGQLLSNGIDDLAIILTQNQTLNDIEIGTSFVSLPDLLALASALTINNSLCDLSIYYSPMKKEPLIIAYQAFYRSLCLNKTLQCLKLETYILDDSELEGYEDEELNACTSEYYYKCKEKLRENRSEQAFQKWLLLWRFRSQVPGINAHTLTMQKKHISDIIEMIPDDFPDKVQPKTNRQDQNSSSSSSSSSSPSSDPTFTMPLYYRRLEAQTEQKAKEQATTQQLTDTLNAQLQPLKGKKHKREL